MVGNLGRRAKEIGTRLSVFLPKSKFFCFVLFLSIHNLRSLILFWNFKSPYTSRLGIQFFLFCTTVDFYIRIIEIYYIFLWVDIG